VSTLTAAAVDRAELARLARRFPARAVGILGAAVAAVGGIILVLGITSEDPARTWWAYHVNFVFWSALAQALVVFAATQKLAKGHWSGFVVRFGEAAVGFQVVALVLYLGLYVGREHIFSWLHEPRADLGWWLTSPWFFVRNFVVLAVVGWLSWRFVRRDLAPDLRELAEGRPVDLDATAKGVISRDAALLVIGYAFGYTLLGYDLVMSLAHKWVSNLYGAFYFMGSLLGALMLLVVLGAAFRAPMGIAALVSAKQRHDLGKLAFGFTVFWAYLMWSQFLVIWYGNLPEETWFVFYRLYGVWRPVGTAVFLMVFLIPFIVLLGARPKKHVGISVAVALVSLAGIWLERYLAIVPSVNHGAGPALGLPEAGVTAFFAGVFLLAYAWFGARYPMVSPRLAADTMERERHH
jgi:hypothetical protein